MIQEIPETTVTYRDGYKITRRPYMSSQYKNGCLVYRRQVHTTKIDKCGNRTRVPLFHNTYKRC